jgi:serine/threonine protein phosphatase PrpC
MPAPESSPAFRSSAAWATSAIVRACGISDVGLVRRTNEDAFVIAELGSGRRWDGAGVTHWKLAGAGVLLAVSDGMGGANAGEVASAISVSSVSRGMMTAARDGRPDGETLRRVIEDASRRVHEEGKRPDRRGMGATFTAVLLAGPTAYVAQIGDSRAYLLRGERIGQVTHDQSYVQMLVDAGVMTPEQAERSSARNIILQVMGQEDVRVVLGRVEVRRGDRLLLCSDGLTNVLDDASIARAATAPRDLAGACAALIAETRRGGAPDNVTVVLAEIA